MKCEALVCNILIINYKSAPLLHSASTMLDRKSEAITPAQHTLNLFQREETPVQGSYYTDNFSTLCTSENDIYQREQKILGKRQN